MLLRDRQLDLATFTDIPSHEIADPNENGVPEERVAEALELLERLLTQEWASFDGIFYELKETSVRPLPSSQLVTGSVRVWGDGLKNTNRRRVRRRDLGADDAATTDRSSESLLIPIYCGNDPDECDRAKSWWIQEFDSEIWHSGIFCHPTTRNISRSASSREISLAINRTFAEAEKMLIAGTPEECAAKIEALIKETNCSEIIFHAHFGLMPVELAESSLELLAEELKRSSGMQA